MIKTIIKKCFYRKEPLIIYITGDTYADFSRFLEKCTFKKWYFGHYHDNRQVNAEFVLLYEDIITLEYESIF